MTATTSAPAPGRASVSDEPAIELAGVSRTTTRTARSSPRSTGVDLAIREGEFFSLLGPSGCGKTTTMRMIAGFEEPTRGSVYLHGVDVTGVPPNKRDVNMVFQSYALFPHMNVYENVAFGLKRKKVPGPEIRRRVGEMLEIVDLTGREKRRPRELSGGQQQRVALARALVNGPRALLLDEPLGALDLKLRQAMQIELKRIQREVGITFVYVTHDQGEALTMSDRIAVMNDGVIEHLGSPREIYEHPATKFVAGFIGTSNLLGGTVAAVDNGQAVIDVGPGERILVPVRKNGVHPGSALELTVRPEKIDMSTSQPDRRRRQRPARCRRRGGLSRHLDELQRHHVDRRRRRRLRPERLVGRGHRRPRRQRLPLLEPTALVRDWRAMNSQTPHDPALIRGLTQRRLSRRDALRISGLSAAGLALAACGVKGQGTPPRRRASPTRSRQFWAGKQKTGHVDFANWPLYMDPEQARAGEVHQGHRHHGDLPGGHRGHGALVRQGAAPALGRPVHRIRPHGHHQRHPVQAVRDLGLPRSARPLEAHQLQGERRASRTRRPPSTRATSTACRGRRASPASRYNADRITRPITKLADLWDPAFRARSA